MPKNVAIFSPNQNAYSETFIQAHKRLPFNIKYYYGGFLPSSLENCSNILNLSFSERIKRSLLNSFSFEEKRLLFSLRREKIQCVLAEYGITACHSLKVIKYLKLPLVAHFHGSDASNRVITDQYRETYKAVFKYASKVVVVSNQMFTALIGLGCPEEKLIINPYGPHDSFFSNKPDFRSRQFISVGRFVEKKAPHLTIFSFKKVVEIYPEARLIMVGDGELLPICKEFSRLLNLENNIKFQDVCTREQIKELFEQSMAFVQHSMTAANGDSEGTPVAILEAQAAGLPVIATFHAGIPDVVINNKTGLLVEERDTIGMSNSMLRLLREEGLAQRLGTAGRKRIREDFTMDKHLGTLAQIMAGIIKE